MELQQKENEITYFRKENEELKQYISQIEYKLLNDVSHLERLVFLKTDSYHLIEKKCMTKGKWLDMDERKQLDVEVHDVFKRLIRTVKKSCPALTNDDILFCCLKRAGLDNMVAGRCIGSGSRQSINQRKYRIKKKMTEAKCNYLFDMIFLPET